MKKDAVRSTRVAPPAGACSAAVSTSHLVFVSAQLPVGTDGRIAGTTPAEQARRAIENLGHQLRSCGLSLDAVVKLTVYAVDPASPPVIDEICAEQFSEPRPARTVLGVAWLPQGALLQIDAVAVRY